jgi:ribonuclease BN (tRNA processing enzyme)
MRLTVVGCGTAAPDAERAAPGFLVEQGDFRILMDCGPGVVHALARLGLDWPAITHVVLTHFHNDHIGDVPALFFAWKYGIRPARSARLELIGPAGTATLILSLPDALGAHIRDPGFAVMVRDATVDRTLPFDGGVVLRSVDTPHTEESLGFRLEADGVSVGYTGDTGPDPSIAAFMAGVDLLIAECSVPDAEAFPQHLTPTSLAELASAAQPGALLVTHVYPQLDRHTVPSLLESAGWRGRTIVAEDGLVLDI